MAKNDVIPNEHHVSRLIGRSKIDDEDDRIDGSAFCLRDGEKYLSVNWLEFLDLPNREEQIQEVRTVLQKKMRNIGATSILAVLNVGVTKEAVSHRTNIRFLHYPSDKDPSHSGIFDLIEEEEAVIGDLIAESVKERFPARN
jgi:hypothetical protein